MGMRKNEYKGAESESGVGLKKVRREEQSELETEFLDIKSMAPAVHPLHHQLNNKSQHKHHDNRICRKRLKVILRVRLDVWCSDWFISQ